MNRIMVIGCCGAGKSTLSRQLHHHLQLPLIHLDQYYWKPGWVESNPKVWNKTVITLANEEKWIIDGNYSGTMDIRLKRAEVVVLVKASTLACLYRVIKRTVLNYGKVRADMPSGCPERFDWKFFAYVLHFNSSRMPGLLKKLEKLKSDKKVFIVDSGRKAEELLKNLKK